MKIGLTLGKFAPLHHGHQLLIERSLAEMDQTVVLIYDCPELDVPALPVRADWIRQLYPQVEVLEAWDGPSEMGLDPAITAQHDAYLKKQLAGRRITHFYSSEPYGEHVSRALDAVDIRVDCARSEVPISATAIRIDPFVQRQFLAPLVYREFLSLVVFLGAPSTGKTTLARELASRLSTVWVPEYGREYWEQHQVDRRLSQEQLVELAVGHRQREDELLMDARRYMFIDTDASTTRQFSHYYHHSAHPELEHMAAECRFRYDVFFLCETDIPYDDTWDRSGDVSRELMQQQIANDLGVRKIAFHRLTGAIESRIEQVLAVLETL